jgi:hypothetical protein
MLKQIKPKSNPIHILLVILAFIVIGICLFFYVTHTPISQDESMYLTAGVLAQNLTLYKDFAYLQMPYLPLIYAFVFRLFGAEYPMLGAQLINYVFIMLSVFMVYILTDKKNYFALALVFFFSFNMIFLKSIDYMANSIAPIPFSLGAFYFFTRNFKPWRYFLSGVLLCISIGIKLYRFCTCIYPGLLSCKQGGKTEC